jgi:hypothetical protein
MNDRQSQSGYNAPKKLIELRDNLIQSLPNVFSNLGDYRHIKVIPNIIVDIENPQPQETTFILLPTAGLIRERYQKQHRKEMPEAEFQVECAAIASEASEALERLTRGKIEFELVPLRMDALEFKNDKARDQFNEFMFGQEPDGKQLIAAKNESVFVTKTLPQGVTALVSQLGEKGRENLYIRRDSPEGAFQLIPVASIDYVSSDPKKVAEHIQNNSHGKITAYPPMTENKPDNQSASQNCDLPKDLSDAPNLLVALILELRRLRSIHGNRYVKPNEMQDLGRHQSKIISDANRRGYKKIVDKYIQRSESKYRFKASADWTKPKK